MSKESTTSTQMSNRYTFARSQSSLSHHQSTDRSSYSPTRTCASLTTIQASMLKAKLQKSRRRLKPSKKTLLDKWKRCLPTSSRSMGQSQSEMRSVSKTCQLQAHRGRASRCRTKPMPTLLHQLLDLMLIDKTQA